MLKIRVKYERKFFLVIRPIAEIYDDSDPEKVLLVVRGTDVLKWLPVLRDVMTFAETKGKLDGAADSHSGCSCSRAGSKCEAQGIEADEPTMYHPV